MTPDKPLSWLDRLGLVCVLALPLCLLASRALGEIDSSLLAGGFLLRTALSRETAWLRVLWVRLCLVWWGWLLLCSCVSPMADTLQAVLLIRWPLLAAALEFWLLRDPNRRRWILHLIRLAALTIAFEEMQQFVTGHNLAGYPRRPSGELTGPYREAKAGPILSRLIFPAALPLVHRGLARGIAGAFAACALLCACAVSIVLFGQRMPAVLTAFGLLVAGLLLPRLRWPALLALLAGGGLVVASAWLAPPTFDRLVRLFSAQLASWPTSVYGELTARAAAIAVAHPVMGLGFDAFRQACLDPLYWHGWPQVLHGARGFDSTPQPPWSDMPRVWAWLNRFGGGYAICAQHPHNHYVQALEESGVPGLILFCALILAWGARLAAHLAGDPLRVGLFVAFLIQEWPIASSSDFVNMPLGGWFFLLLGLGLAEARHGGAGPLFKRTDTA